MLLISKLQQFSANDGLNAQRVGAVGLVAGYAHIFVKTFLFMISIIAAAVSLTVLTGSDILGFIVIVSVASFLVLRLAKTKNLLALQKQAQDFARLFIKTVIYTNQIVEFISPHRDSFKTRVTPVPTTPPRA